MDASRDVRKAVESINEHFSRNRRVLYPINGIQVFEASGMCSLLRSCGALD